VSLLSTAEWPIKQKHECIAPAVGSRSGKSVLRVLPFEIDHIIAEQYYGKTVASNLVLTCLSDNRNKGPISPELIRNAPSDMALSPASTKMGPALSLERTNVGRPDACGEST
jgi:hypothetical protein